MRDRRPGVAGLVLTANLRSAAADSTYLKMGFHDYPGTNSGPRHVFSLPLR